MSDKRPNILVLTTDQHRFDALSCRGHRHVRTPNLDSLVGASVDFNSAFTQAPVCAPARYSLATGQYVNTHGVRFNEVNPTRSVRTIAHHLGEAGYQCHQLGHMHWSRETTDTGYEPLVSRDKWLQTLRPEWRDRICREHDTDFIRTTMGGPSPVPEEAFFAHYLAGETIRKLDEAATGDAPFLCWTSIYEPHPPFFAPADVYARFDQSAFGLPPQAPGSNPPVERKQIERRKKWAHLSPVEIRQNMAGYFGLVEVADRAIGRILDHLKATGLLENTWIVWTSDHGEQLFDHELFLKFCMYEQSVHVPFTIRGPGLNSAVRSELVEHVDLFPTLCELCGTSIPASVEGASLKPLLGDGPVPEDWRPIVFSQINNFFMARTEKWKLMVRFGQPVELYNLAEDPSEFHNRVDDPGCSGIREMLLAEVNARFKVA
jgi:arylsulfatase A-like enzyme